MSAFSKSMNITNIFSLLCLHVAKLGFQLLVFYPHEIGSHLLRSGVAMTLHHSRIPDSTIKIIGLWYSYSFLVYLQGQVATFTKGVAMALAKLPGSATRSPRRALLLQARGPIGDFWPKPIPHIWVRFQLKISQKKSIWRPAFTPIQTFLPSPLLDHQAEVRLTFPDQIPSTSTSRGPIKNFLLKLHLIPCAHIHSYFPTNSPSISSIQVPFDIYLPKPLPHFQVGVQLEISQEHSIWCPEFILVWHFRPIHLPYHQVGFHSKFPTIGPIPWHPPPWIKPFEKKNLLPIWSPAPSSHGLILWGQRGLSCLFSPILSKTNVVALLGHIVGIIGRLSALGDGN